MPFSMSDALDTLEGFGSVCFKNAKTCEEYRRLYVVNMAARFTVFSIFRLLAKSGSYLAQALKTPP